MAAVEHQVATATPLYIKLGELSGDLGERRILLGRAPDSTCRTCARLSRINIAILRMGCKNIPIAPPPLIRCHRASCPGSKGSLTYLRARLGQTCCCCSRASFWLLVGAPSPQRCASWDEIAITTSAPSTASSIVPRGRRERPRAGCFFYWSTPSCLRELPW